MIYFLSLKCIGINSKNSVKMVIYFIVQSNMIFEDVNILERMENIVYVELLQIEYMVDVGKLSNKEIDFVARKRDETLYVQVAYELPDNNHETDNLLNIKDNYKKIVVTGRYHEVEQIDGISIVYIVDWLLGE
ncbi:hypothetical protein SAMN04488559_10111 [Isobaculum melis]|uniref:DUF4143 domain-containing protein n=1 Tax=Isobaculum melis TaxID=142588 RepID=A0A1H9PM43_9LACT|nr:hypothetical protein SAMN04488559_10111 [Isobaculum melis]